VRGFAGADALERAFDEVEFDVLVNAVVGSAGLWPSYLALSRGKSVATANKESLVIGGSLLCRTAAAHGACLLPTDSEHSAIWQCLRAGTPAEIETLWLTASGGPFLKRDPATFPHITRADALAHPTWNMGPKITVDSATMMNKGFEIIEAHWLFGVPADRIRVVIHPQSVVHSAVAFRDGSVIAQLGVPDMKLPIAYALLQPDRSQAGSQLELDRLGGLQFEAPDPERFPSLPLARRALAAGDESCVALNAANEEAVAAFLAGGLGFSQIHECVAAQLDKAGGEQMNDLHDIYEVEGRTRHAAREWIGRRGQGEAAGSVRN
jgi:1-deoxy-D-xylulose-5-phosphate reductoisomerase